jgi:hypothetical protein
VEPALVKYRVELYFDGPVLNARGTVTIMDAASEADAVREAIVYLGLPKIGKVQEITT